MKKLATKIKNAKWSTTRKNNASAHLAGGAFTVVLYGPTTTRVRIVETAEQAAEMMLSN